MRRPVVRRSRAARPAPWIALALLALLAALAAGAQQTGSQPGVHEGGVHEGANDRFLDPGLDVAAWQARFESEAREIHRHRAGIAAALKLAPGMAVADVGAGTGLFLPLLAEAVGAEGRVYAVEVSPRFLEHLGERVRREGLARVEVVEGKARGANLPEGALDRVLLVDTYHHFEHPAAMLASLHGALRAGGELLVVDFERIPGRSRDWVLEHVRAGKGTVRDEIASAGFELLAEVEVAGLEENYVLRFRRP